MKENKYFHKYSLPNFIKHLSDCIFGWFLGNNIQINITHKNTHDILFSKDFQFPEVRPKGF